MKKKLYILLTTLSGIIFILFLLLRISFHQFQVREVLNDINYLSSEKFNGRLCGSPENYLVSEYIGDEFKDLGLTPLGKDYKDGFKVIAPFENGKSPLLEIKNNKYKKSFKYGVDFKEDMINFKTPKITLSAKDNLNILNNSLSFSKDGNIFLFYVNKESEFDFRSSFCYDSPIAFAVAVSEKAYNEIVSSLTNGEELTVSLPYSIEEREVFNVASKIEGKDSSIPPLILTAHFDHLGSDFLNNVYGGALDNASGTSFLLEMARHLKSLPQPNRDIIFVALNGEEFGLLGSDYFASKYKKDLKGSIVINFDMIGAENYPITFMLGKSSFNTDSPLLEDLKNISNRLKLDSNVRYEDSSDHGSFSKNGFDSLTISHGDVSKIHTPNDRVEFISSEGVYDVFKLTKAYIYSNCYSEFSKITFNPSIHAFSFLIFLILISYPVIKRIDDHKKNIK